MKAVGITDIGLQRKRNEDAYLIDLNRKLFLVCDGMGGHRAGDVASRMAVDTIDQQFNYNHWNEVPDALHEAIKIANQNIWKAGQQDEAVREMGTTVTAAVINQGKIVIAHVGDSSLYIIRNLVIEKLTRDHTLAEQMLLDGLLKQEDMRSNAFNHILTRALGIDSQVNIDIIQENVQAGDWILLCTDGLSNLVDGQDILAILDNQHEPQEAAQELMDMALSRGGHDNITIVLVRL